MYVRMYKHLTAENRTFLPDSKLDTKLQINQNTSYI